MIQVVLALALPPPHVFGSPHISIHIPHAMPSPIHRHTLCIHGSVLASFLPYNLLVAFCPRLRMTSLTEPRSPLYTPPCCYFPTSPAVFDLRPLAVILNLLHGSSCSPAGQGSWGSSNGYFYTPGTFLVSPHFSGSNRESNANSVMSQWVVSGIAL